MKKRLSLGRTIVSIGALLLFLATVPGVSHSQQKNRSNKNLTVLKRNFGNLKYIILPAEGRGGSAVAQYNVPLDYASPRLPAACLSKVNLKRKRMRKMPMYENLALSTELPPRLLVQDPNNRAWTEGEELFDPGFCRKIRLRIGKKKVSSESYFFPNQRKQLVQQFCSTDSDGSKHCQVPKTELTLNYDSSTENSSILVGERHRQVLKLRRMRVGGINVVRAQVSVAYSWPETSPLSSRNAAASYCGVACSSPKACENQIAKLGEEGLRELCQDAPPDSGSSCPSGFAVPSLSSPQQCAIFRDYSIANFEPDPILSPYAALVRDHLDPRTCCFNVASCQTFYEPVFACDSAVSECVVGRSLTAALLASLVPACQGYAPPVL